MMCSSLISLTGFIELWGDHQKLDLYIDLLFGIGFALLGWIFVLITGEGMATSKRLRTILSLTLYGMLLPFFWLWQSILGLFTGDFVAVFAWAFPYVLGNMFHHSLARQTGRFIGWLFVFLMIICIWGLWIVVLCFSEGGRHLSIVWLGATSLVMGVQTLAWGVSWFEHWQSRQISGWRTVAAVAFLTSLPVTVVAISSVLDELDSRHLSQQMETDRLVRMEQAGYQQYPSAEFPSGTMVRQAGSEDGESLIIEFHTGDSPEKVLGFYEQSAKKAGMKVRRGYTRPKWASPKSLPDPTLVAVREDGVTMKVVRTFATLRPDEPITKPLDTSSYRWIVEVLFLNKPDQIKDFEKQFNWVNP